MFSCRDCPFHTQQQDYFGSAQINPYWTLGCRREAIPFSDEMVKRYRCPAVEALIDEPAAQHKPVPHNPSVMRIAVMPRPLCSARTLSCFPCVHGHLRGPATRLYCRPLRRKQAHHKLASYGSKFTYTWSFHMSLLSWFDSHRGLASILAVSYYRLFSLCFFRIFPCPE